MDDRYICSVLLCTYNRGALLAQTLESLCQQTLNNGCFEVIVLDDGSTDETASVAKSFESRIPLRYAYQRNSGLASARNHALFLSAAKIVLLLDDDDVAHPQLLEEHLRIHELYPEDNYAVLGYTELAADIAGDPLMYFATAVGKFLFSYPDIHRGQVLDYSYFWGGRSSCKRRFLLEHGVFNPIFKFGCEDIELAYRLSKSGFRVVYNPSAITTMIRAFTFDQFCERLIKQGRSNYIFSQLHDDGLVRAWTEVDDVKKWAVLEPAYDAMRQSGRSLDALYRSIKMLGMADAEHLRLLHESYWTTFRASKIKGIAEAFVEKQGSESLRPSSASIASTPNLSAPITGLLRSSPPIHGELTWGLSEDVLAFLDRTVTEDSETLETGSGLSTLVFAAKRTHHTCITPSQAEIDRILEHCSARGVVIDRLSFEVAFSHECLPRLQHGKPLDLVLIDGGHGFPIPFLDWLYCAPRIKVGGIVIVDDTQLWTGEVLAGFLAEDPDWALEERFVRSAAFRKVAEFRRKEWNEQPYVLARSHT